MNVLAVTCCHVCGQPVAWDRKTEHLVSPQVGRIGGVCADGHRLRLTVTLMREPVPA